MLRSVCWQIAGAMQTAVGARYRAVAFCDALHFISDTLNRMHVNVTNIRLRLMRPMISDHGVEYLMGKMVSCPD